MHSFSHIIARWLNSRSYAAWKTERGRHADGCFSYLLPRSVFLWSSRPYYSTNSFSATRSKIARVPLPIASGCDAQTIENSIGRDTKRISRDPFLIWNCTHADVIKQNESKFTLLERVRTTLEKKLKTSSIECVSPSLEDRKKFKKG